VRCWIHCAEARGASIGNPQSYPKNLRAGLLDPLIGSAATVKLSFWELSGVEFCPLFSVVNRHVHHPIRDDISSVNRAYCF